MQKPGHIFLFLLVLGSVILGLSVLSPKEPIKIGPFELSFYQPQDLLGLSWEEEQVDSLDTFGLMDSLSLDSLPEEVIEIVTQKPVLDTTLQIAKWDVFAPIFDALSDLKAGKRSKVRIIHYGDSQLEGDRITMQLRNSLQKQYGGRGFGYVAMEPLVEPASLDFIESQGLLRKTAFGRRDTAIKDMAYGHLASFTMLEANEGSSGYSGYVTFSKRNWGYSLARDFSKVKMSVGTTAMTIVQIWVADTIYSTQSLPENTEGTVDIEVPDAESFTLAMQSDVSPRIYGLSFESATGVHVDNVAMRGASGMVFSKLDPDQFQRQLQREDYQLIILQYGGNAVPYLKDEGHARRFARSAARQIDHIKRLYPGAAIIYIGPSDMARKNGLKMESYPLIKPFKAALRAEVLSRGAAYWDLYDVMGGEGSMVRWVDQEPAFAVKDYIHFTPKGAQWVGNALAAQLNAAQQTYILEIERQTLETKRKKDSIDTWAASLVVDVDSNAIDTIQP